MAPSTDLILCRFAHRAMATQFEWVFPWGTCRADEVALDLNLLVDRLESQLTVYRDSSEVSRLNRLGAAAPVPVEKELFDLLLLCREISAMTRGAFDITSAPLISAWGFFRRQGRVPSEEEIQRALSAVGMDGIIFDANRYSVRFARRGIEVNLGSIGKGYALDRLAARIRGHWNVNSALLNGGTSSVLAIGSPPNDVSGWTVGLTDPWNRSRRLGLLKFRDRAMASSGATFQHFEYNGKKLGHLIDPRSGRPAEGVDLAVALAPTAAEADALATAFYVMGVEDVRAFCRNRPDVSALILPEGGGAELVACNLNAEEWMPGGEVMQDFDREFDWDNP